MKKVLLLNASEEIVDVIGWQRAATLLFQGKAKRPHNHNEEYEITTTSGIFRLPTALVLVQYVRIPYKRSALNKDNVLKRDGYICQYCGDKLSSTTGTMDHVMPRSRGGKHTWKNVVACCRPCNNKKDNMTPGEAKMKLKSKPFVPHRDILIVKGVDVRTHQTWTRWVEL